MCWRFGLNLARPSTDFFLNSDTDTSRPSASKENSTRTILGSLLLCVWIDTIHEWHCSSSQPGTPVQIPVFLLSRRVASRLRNSTSPEAERSIHLLALSARSNPAEDAAAAADPAG
jgi:hypothetical protein